MVFSGLTFLYFFLPIVMLVYFLLPKGRNALIFASGIIFYAWGEPFYVVIMLLSTTIDYLAGRFMDKWDDNEKRRKICLLVSVCMNVGLLAIFKYSDFLIDSINALFSSSITNPVLLVNKALNKICDFGLNEKSVDLPIGISFFTFQSMSYTIDLYRRKIKVQNSFITFASYVSLFPQIVAGPIVRYETVASELEDRKVSLYKVNNGVSIFIRGLAKKILLANNIGLIWDNIKAMDYSEISTLTAWIGILSFTLQIYYDFSGYSDMAIGLGKMMGFEFPINFEYPYISKSISEFWRRWHITLGTWFREYVYIPLGGNRNGAFKTYRNLVIVWALTGLWHGASWNFVLWGLYFGVLIILERVANKAWGKTLEKLPSIISTAYTFILVMLGWVLFDTDSLSLALDYYKALFNTNTIWDSYALFTLSQNIVLIVACVLLAGGLGSKLINALTQRYPRTMAVAGIIARLLVVFICTCYLADDSYTPFMYFRF